MVIISQGVELLVRVPTEMLEALVLVKCVECASRHKLEQLPGAGHNPCNHCVGNSIMSMKLWVIQKSLIQFTIDSRFLLDIFLNQVYVENQTCF